MNKTVIGVLLALVVAGGAVALVVSGRDEKPSTPATQSTNATTDQVSGNTNPETEQPEARNTQQQGDVQIDIRNQAYNPAKTTVKAGTKVTWVNQDSTQHDVAPDEDYGDAFTGSELLNRGQSYSFTFTEPGTYTYHCTPHPFMKGTIEVTQ